MLNYELLLKGGHVLDPSTSLDGAMDIAINGDRIAALAPNIEAEDAVRVIELAEGDIVTPGLIDLHTHTAKGITRHSCDPDRAGVEVGVTTVVDGGSLGSHTFIGFRSHVYRTARTRALVFLNLSYAGQARMPELRSVDDFDRELTSQVIRENRDIVCGVKIRAVSPMIETIGAQAVDLAHDVLDGLPLMVHIGDHGRSPQADQTTREIVARLHKGDIITHPYTPFPGGLLQNGRPIPELEDALGRGVIIDVARGRMNFSFAVAQQLIAAGITPHTISTDLTAMNRSFMVYCLTEVMSIFLNFGFSLPEVIEMSSRRPALALGMSSEIGSLRPGMKADISVLRYTEGEFEFHAQEGESFQGTKAIYPVICVRDGVVFPSSPPAGSAGAKAQALEQSRVGVASLGGSI